MIELRALSVVFAGETVLGPIDLTLDEGAFIGLIGPPGSGKSLLLKVIAGLVRPKSGLVRVLGEDLATLDHRALDGMRRRIGMVFQNNALFDSRTIFENVAFPLRGRRAGRAEDAALTEAELDTRVRARLKEVGLAGNESLYPHELSGGMQKRAGIARANAADPEVRLYDEPTAGLDPVTSARILALIAANQTRAPGVSVVISNEMDSMLEVVPRVVMLHRGRIVFDGPRAALDSDAAPELAKKFVRGDVNVQLA